MTTINIIGLVLNLILTVLSEIFSARARARERDEKFELDKKKFLEIVDSALANMRDEVKKENDSIGDLEDEIDRSSL